MPTFCFFSRARRTRISIRVKSGSAATRSSSHCSCFLSGERLWPVPGFSSTVPVFRQCAGGGTGSEPRCFHSNPLDRLLLKRIVLVGDRGMATSQNLDQLKNGGHSYIVGRNRCRSGEVFDYILRATGPWIECPAGVTAREKSTCPKT
jgi:hypothetical protein